MSELLPCPFCGGQPRLVDDLPDDGGSVIECLRCMASSAVHFDRCENLVSEWNRRAPVVPEETMDELRNAVNGAPTHLPGLLSRLLSALENDSE